MITARVLNQPITFKNEKLVPRIKDMPQHIIDLSLWFIEQTNVDNDHMFNRMAIHVCDCIQCGTINYVDGLSAKEFVLKNGYFPEWCSVRESNYSHTI